MTINEYQNMAMRTLNPKLEKRISCSTGLWGCAVSPER